MSSVRPTTMTNRKYLICLPCRCLISRRMVVLAADSLSTACFSVCPFYIRRLKLFLQKHRTHQSDIRRLNISALHQNRLPGDVLKRAEASVAQGFSNHPVTSSTSSQVAHSESVVTVSVTPRCQLPRVKNEDTLRNTPANVVDRYISLR